MHRCGQYRDSEKLVFPAVSMLENGLFLDDLRLFKGYYIMRDTSFALDKLHESSRWLWKRLECATRLDVDLICDPIGEWRTIAGEFLRRDMADDAVEGC